MVSDKSGLPSQLPPVFTKPFWRDRFFWLFVATLAFWVVVIAYFFA